VVSVICIKCKTQYTAKGTADCESVGDGGPACCTGVELDEPECPGCGSDECEIVCEIDPDYD